MNFIANIWAYSDLLAGHIATLGLDFPVYAGKPIIEPKWKYAYFRLESNRPSISDDTSGILHKKADFDFIFVGGSRDMSDREIYEMLDDFSRKFLTEKNEWIILGKNFKIFSILDGDQSGVMRNEKENPLLLAVFSLRYQYRYGKNPRE